MLKLNQLTTAEAMSHPDVALTINTLGKMADELRTQKQALLEALKKTVTAIDLLTDKVDGTGFSSSHEFLNALDEMSIARAAIAQAEGKGV